MTYETEDFKTARARRGGLATAKNMTDEQKKTRASAAAAARWTPEMPQAECEGSFRIGDHEIMAAVLPNGKRLLSQGTFLQAIGRSRTPKAGTGVMAAVDGLPSFLQADALKPFITDELRESTTPIYFRMKNGQRAVGYDAKLLPMVCDVYLRLRDARDESGRPLAQYAHVIKACDILTRGLARVGIVALVDEATGYQDRRAKDALAKILEAFVTKELKPYVKTFPIDYYREIYRLNGWDFPPRKNRHNSNLGKMTNDLVYARLAPGVKDELHRLTPRAESGRLKHKMFQHLTDEIGSPKLREHFAALIMAMKLNKTWKDFKGVINAVLPKYAEQEPKAED